MCTFREQLKGLQEALAAAQAEHMDYDFLQLQLQKYEATNEHQHQVPSCHSLQLPWSFANHIAHTQFSWSTNCICFQEHEAANVKQLQMPCSCSLLHKYWWMFAKLRNTWSSLMEDTLTWWCNDLSQRLLLLGSQKAVISAIIIIAIVTIMNYWFQHSGSSIQVTIYLYVSLLLEPCFLVLGW